MRKQILVDFKAEWSFFLSFYVFPSFFVACRQTTAVFYYSTSPKGITPPYARLRMFAGQMIPRHLEDCSQILPITLGTHTCIHITYAIRCHIESSCQMVSGSLQICTYVCVCVCMYARMSCVYYFCGCLSVRLVCVSVCLLYASRAQLTVCVCIYVRMCVT